MKSRLGASIFPFSVVTLRRYSRKAISSRSMVISSGLRYWKMDRSLQALGFESSSRATHSSAVEDEAFSVLGPEVSECSTKQIKLVTEKPDHLLKRDHSRRELPGRPLSSDTRPRIKDIVGTIGRDSPTPNSKLGGRNHASKLTDDSKKISHNIESQCRVSVKNIHPEVGLSELVEAVSVFGKVSGASLETASDGVRCCNIEFEDVESSKRAILAGKIAVGSQAFQVHAVDVVAVVSFRIRNINKVTTDHAIHSQCKSLGELLGLVRTSKDVVDVFFNVQNDRIHVNILRSLNKTVIDLNRWSAEVLTSKAESSETSSKDEARYNLGLQVNDQIWELKKQLGITKVCLEDLGVLHASIMHIERSPPNLSGSK